MSEFDFDAPSFSLGLDFEEDPSSSSSLPTINDSVRVSNLKRLRRGPTPIPNLDADDIEDFSSDQEHCHFPTGNVSTCSSSKFSLHEKKILTSESAKQSISRKKRDSCTTEEKNNGSNVNNFMFPELTVSPLRKFQLIDSDSDDGPHVSRSTSGKLPHVTLSSKENQSRYNQVGKYKTQDDDLWKDFCPEKSSYIPTPAFDEICNEYYLSGKQKTGIEDHFKETSNHGEMLIPAHSYFFHNDPIIQKLVRDRLPNFFPLGAGNNQQNESAIDYMGQFGSNECSSSGKKTTGRSSVKTKKNVKKSQVENGSLDSEKWINPKSCERLSNDVGKRRVQAVGKSAGHWFTGSDGQRVYVNKGGQELTGRMAYVQYKKESGKGFKNSKKQTGTEKKAATKKKYIRKK